MTQQGTKSCLEEEQEKKIQGKKKKCSRTFRAHVHRASTRSIQQPHLFDKDQSCRQLGCQKATVNAHCLLPPHFQTLRQFISTNKNFIARFLMTYCSRPSGYKNTALKILKCRITGQACQRKKERKEKKTGTRKKRGGGSKSCFTDASRKVHITPCMSRAGDRPTAQRPVKNAFQTTEPDRELRPLHRCGRASTDQR